MKSVLYYKDDYLYESITENGHKTMVDMRPLGDKKNQSPVEMVLSALGGCAAVEVVAMIKKRRKTVNDLQVVTVGERKEDHPKWLYRTNLHFKLFSPDAKEEELSKAVKLTLNNYCSVASSLKSEITFSVEVLK